MPDDMIARMLKEYQRVDHEQQGLDPYEAMRAAWAVAAEPTDAMIERGWGWEGMSKESLVDLWQAMHGAADGK